MNNCIYRVSLLLTTVLLLFWGCKKNDDSAEEDEIQDEVICEEIIQLLDNCPTTYYKDIRAFGFQYKEDNLLDKMFSAMCTQALFLTDTLPYGDQKGLAYVNGFGIPQSKTKDYRIPRIGTWKDGIDCVCQDSLYGTDCSGFIAHVMNAVGIKGLFQKTADQQVSYFKNLKELNTSLFKGKVKVKEIDVVSEDNIKNGDIIYKLNGTRVNHIGIFFKTTNGKIIMFQSSGSPSYSCDQNRHEAGRGPIQKELNAENLNAYFGVGSGNARLLRIIPMFFFSDTPFNNTKWRVPVTYQASVSGSRRVGDWHSSNGGYYTYHTESYSDSDSGNDLMLLDFLNNKLVFANDASQSVFDFREDSIFMTIEVEGVESSFGLLNDVALLNDEGNLHSKMKISRWFSNEQSFCLKIVTENTITENIGNGYQYVIKMGGESLTTFSMVANSNQCSYDTRETTYIDVPQYPSEYVGILHQNSTKTYHGTGTWELGVQNRIIKD